MNPHAVYFTGCLANKYSISKLVILINIDTGIIKLPIFPGGPDFLKIKFFKKYCKH